MNYCFDKKALVRVGLPGFGGGQGGYIRDQGCQGYQLWGSDPKPRETDPNQKH